MIKILLAGSPCTFWSISQKNNREIKPEGLGWDLFENCLIAKDKFQPHIFLYENNVSAAKEIKEQIKKEFGVDNENIFYNEINSALFGAQKRERFYVHNCGVLTLPTKNERVVKDMVDEDAQEIVYLLKNKTTNVKYDKYKPIRIGDIGSQSQAHRVYSENGKSVTINAGGGGQGGKTGLYEITAPDGLKSIRKLTVLECERLQNLPDNFTKVNGISDAQRYKTIGNGWTASVVEFILESGLKDVNRNEELVVVSLYDGISTGRLVLERMGFTNIKYFSYEIDSYAIQISQYHFPSTIQLGDAFQVREEKWLESFEKLYRNA